jgi:hypothetical protein
VKSCLESSLLTIAEKRNIFTSQNVNPFTHSQDFFGGGSVHYRQSCACTGQCKNSRGVQTEGPAAQSEDGTSVSLEPLQLALSDHPRRCISCVG